MNRVARSALETPRYLSTVIGIPGSRGERAKPTTFMRDGARRSYQQRPEDCLPRNGSIAMTKQFDIENDAQFCEENPHCCSPSMVTRLRASDREVAHEETPRVSAAASGNTWIRGLTLC